MVSINISDFSSVILNQFCTIIIEASFFASVSFISLEESFSFLSLLMCRSWTCPFKHLNSLIFKDFIFLSERSFATLLNSCSSKGRVDLRDLQGPHNQENLLHCSVYCIPLHKIWATQASPVMAHMTLNYRSFERDILAQVRHEPRFVKFWWDMIWLVWW